MIFTINTTCCMHHHHGTYADDDLKNTTTAMNHNKNMTHYNTYNTNDTRNIKNNISDESTIMNDVWDHIILPTVPIICDIYVETDNNANTKTIRIPNNNNNKSNSSSNDYDDNYQQQQLLQELTKLLHENIHVQYKQLLFPCVSTSSTSNNNDPMQSPATRTNTIHFPSSLLLRPHDHRNKISSGRISWSNCHLQPFSIQNILEWFDSNNNNNNYMLERKQHQNKQQYIVLPIIPTPQNHIVWQHIQQQSKEMENNTTNSTNGENQIVVNLQQSLDMDTSYAKRIFIKLWKKHLRVIFLNTTTAIEHNDNSTTLSINGTPVNTINVDDLERDAVDNFVPSTKNNDVDYVTSKFDFDSLFMNATRGMTTAVPKNKEENKEIPLHADDTIDIDATDHVVQQNTSINDTTNIIKNTSHQPISFSSEGQIYEAPQQQRNSHELVQEQQRQRPKNNINQHNHHRIIFEQMMEKEMNDIHTILVVMCLTAIAIILFLGYSLHKQQQQSLAITTNLRSTKSNSLNHENSRSGGSRYRYSNSNNRAICPYPPYTNRNQIKYGNSDHHYHRQQQPNYDIDITTSTSSQQQHNVTVSPLSLDPIFMHQQHQQDHNHDDDSTIPLSDKMDTGTDPNNDKGTPTLSRSQSFLPNPPPAIKSTVVPLLSSSTDRCLNRIGDKMNQDRPNRRYIHHLQEENIPKHRQVVSTDSRNPRYHEIEIPPTNVKAEAQILNKENANKADVFESIQITEPVSQPFDKHECCEKFLFEQICTKKVLLTSTNDTVSPISNTTTAIVIHDSQQETDLVTMKPVAVVTPEAQRSASNSTDDLLINGSCSFMDDYWKAT